MVSSRTIYLDVCATSYSRKSKINSGRGWAEGCRGKGECKVWDGFFIVRVNIKSVAMVTPRCK